MTTVETDVLYRELKDSQKRESDLRAELRECKAVREAYERCIKIIEALIEDDSRR